MLEYKQSRLQMEPINCNYITPSGENLDSLEFRRVICRGVFDDSKSIYVGPRSRSISGVTENGYYLITPLMPLPSSPERLFHHFCLYSHYSILSKFVENILQLADAYLSEQRMGPTKLERQVCENSKRG